MNEKGDKMKKEKPNEEIFENYGYNPDEQTFTAHDGQEHDCDCDDCDCHHDHQKFVLHKNHTQHGYYDKKTGKTMCVLEEGQICTNCGACDMCDLDPNKVCDNCGKCLDTLETDEKGYVHVPVDKIIMDDDETTLEEFYQMYGLDDDDEGK